MSIDVEGYTQVHSVMRRQWKQRILVSALIRPTCCPQCNWTVCVTC